jgi:hypothetical protein
MVAILMQCHNPYIPPGNPDVPAPCRKCIACRVNAKRLWTHRLILETKAHEKSSFITLTYDEHNHPEDGSLSIPEIQKFIKRLRKRISPRRIRYYAVGEYGDRSWRPHYHLAIYGLSCELGGACSGIKKREIQKRCEKYGSKIIPQREWYFDKICKTCQEVELSWDKGFIDVAELNPTTAGYICGYATKKLTKPEDERLHFDGTYLHPEFCTQSKNIGLDGLYKLLDEWKKSPFFEKFLTPMGDVPYSLSHDGKSYPIGRHLRQKAREYLKLEEAYDEKTGEIKYVSKEAEKIQRKKELQVLRSDEKVSPDAKVSLKHFMYDQNFQRNKIVDKRNKIFRKEKPL